MRAKKDDQRLDRQPAVVTNKSAPTSKRECARTRINMCVNSSAGGGSQRTSSTKKPPTHVESAAESARRVEMRIDLPVALKSILVDDSDYVNGDELMVGEYVEFPSHFCSC